MNLKNLRVGKTLFVVRVGAHVGSAHMETLVITKGVFLDQFNTPQILVKDGGVFERRLNLVDINVVASGINLNKAFLCKQAAVRYTARMRANNLRSDELDIVLINEQFSMLMDDEFNDYDEALLDVAA